MTNLNQTNASKRDLQSAQSYEDWSNTAQMLDQQSGGAAWRLAEKDRRFDYKRIRERLDLLREARESDDAHEVLFALNEGIHGNLGGIANSSLYNQSIFGTKHLIEDYIAEVTEALQYLAETDDRVIPYEERIDFFRRASHCYGRTALMLSGAGARTPYHFGVVGALLEEDLLPDIISGSSGGAIVAGIIGSCKPDELADRLSLDAMRAIHESVTPDQKSRRLFPMPVRAETLRQLVNEMLPDLTFEEAYDLSGRHINISVASDQTYQKSRLLNAITTPHVYLREAVLASCSVPGVFPAVTLASKDHHGERKPYLPELKWIDGSVTDDLPARRIGRLYGVNHFIASMTNPAVLWSLRDHSDLPQPIKIARKWGDEVLKANLRATQPLVRTLSKQFGSLGSMHHIFYSVALQQYTADINILPSQRFMDPRKILSPISWEDTQILYEDGRRVTWPKIEMIRNTTMISRCLDDILLEYQGAADTAL
nr:DUF3336 domain-containing protein [Hyphomonas sp. Mor2]